MATVTRITLTCDVCGNAKDVKTWLFGLDGKTYEIDLCRKDGNALGRLAAGYIAKARKATARHGHRRRGGRPRVRAATAARGDGARAIGAKASGEGRVTGSGREEAKTGRPQQQAATVGGVTAAAAGSSKAAKASRLQLHNPDGASTLTARAARVRQRKGIYVYGILPEDIEVTAGIRGVGEDPGLLRDVRLDRLTALVSDVDLSRPLGSADDRRTYREILDATAVEAPVLPLPFGTVLASEDAVAEELLAAHHAEFTAALDQLEGRAEFRVKGRYVKDAVLGAVLSQNKQAARLRDAIQGQHRDAAPNARTELGRFIREAVTARREEDTRALRQAMHGVCVASVALELTHELDAVRGAFLVALDRECEVERVVEDLAREWEGRIDVQLLGPMAAYDFTGPAQIES